MTVTYIGHSGFLLEMEDAYFLFDYFEGEIPEFKNDKNIVVFSSHRHHDHFNPEILELIKKYPDIQYVLSSDIPINWHIRKYRSQGINLAKNILRIKKNVTENFRLSNGKELSVKTFKSTDEGVAFLLKYDGGIYYHAGDLNCWDWTENTDAYRSEMVRLYTDEIIKMKDMSIDVAFVPLDPRLESTSYEGMEIFLENTKAKTVFPMHCWGKYNIIKEFVKKHPEYKEQIRIVDREGQVFEI